MAPKPPLYSLYVLQTTTCSLVKFVQSCSNTWALGNLAFITGPFQLLQPFSCHIKMALKPLKRLYATRDNVFHMSGRPCVFTLARPDSPQYQCFRSSPIPISFSTFQVGRTFRILWSTFHRWMPRLWCTPRKRSRKEQRHPEDMTMVSHVGFFCCLKNESEKNFYVSLHKTVDNYGSLYDVTPINRIPNHQSSADCCSILIALMRWTAFRVAWRGQIQLLLPKRNSEEMVWN